MERYVRKYMCHNYKVLIMNLKFLKNKTYINECIHVSTGSYDPWSTNGNKLP